jgi:hypothetical protein
MTLRLGCRFQLVFLQAWHSTTGHWASSSLAFAMLASPCDSVLATPALPHFASPTCFVHSPVSRSAKSVGLAGPARYLSCIVLWTRFIPPFHGARRTASYPTGPARIPACGSELAPGWAAGPPYRNLDGSPILMPLCARTRGVVSLLQASGDRATPAWLAPTLLDRSPPTTS